MKDSRWVPFWLPFLVFGIVAFTLASLGILLLNIAVATHDWFPAIHSLVVIIVALAISLLIVVVATVYARTGSKNGSSHAH